MGYRQDQLASAGVMDQVLSRCGLKDGFDMAEFFTKPGMFAKAMEKSSKKAAQKRAGKDKKAEKKKSCD